MDLLLIISSLVLWIEKFYCCWFQTSGETRPTQSIESWNLITGPVLPRQGGNLLISSCQHIRNYYGERHSTWCSLLSWVGREGKEENSWIAYTIFKSIFTLCRPVKCCWKQAGPWHGHFKNFIFQKVITGLCSCIIDLKQ